MLTRPQGARRVEGRGKWGPKHHLRPLFSFSRKPEAGVWGEPWFLGTG